MSTPTNHLNKYLDLPKKFMGMCIDINVALKQQERVLVHIAKSREVRDNEKLSDFVIKSAELNQKTEELLVYLKDFLQEVAGDAEAVMDGARLRNKLQDSSETIEHLIHQRDIKWMQLK